MEKTSLKPQSADLSGQGRGSGRRRYLFSQHGPCPLVCLASLRTPSLGPPLPEKGRPLVPPEST